MRIVVASGKGGTGKTTVATSLALSLATGGEWELPGGFPPLFLDCDVEAPNAHLFLDPVIEERRDVGILLPIIDENICSGCGKCAEVCQYHAIAALAKIPYVFSELCHGCGSCSLICPEKAITERLKVTGVLERGATREGIAFGRGDLRVGEPMAVPVIRQLKRWLRPQAGQVVIIDAPPGTSCPVVETIRDSDFTLLVTEPTPFGLHDLKMAVDVTRVMGVAAGVIINRENQTIYSPLEDYCGNQDIPILMRIPFELAIARGTAQGFALTDILPIYKTRFRDLFSNIVLRRHSSKSIQSIPIKAGII